MMKEDVLADIRNHADSFGHYHTGGLPAGTRSTDTQTLDYPKIMRAIVASGYTGYVGQEFIPKRPDNCAGESRTGRGHLRRLAGRP